MSGTVQAALTQAAARLTAVGVPDAARDARLLMAAALGIPPAQITPRARDPLSERCADVFAHLVAARLSRQPVAQILGVRAFWGREFEITADVLDPRPETETLIARALDGARPARLLDLGTGSGILIVTLLAEWPGSRGTGTDVSAAALAVATRNAARHGVADRADIRQADWFLGVDGPFDLIVSNPPYIPEGEIAALSPDVRDWEPHLALTPGPTGLESYAAIARGLPAALAPGGRALFEIGAGQGADVTAIIRAAGLEARIHADLDGRARVVEAAFAR